MISCLNQNSILREDKLDWGRTEPGENHLIVDELYRTYLNPSDKKTHQRQMEEYWKRRGQIALEQVEFICQPVEDDIDVWIIKTEYWEIKSPNIENMLLITDLNYRELQLMNF